MLLTKLSKKLYSDKRKFGKFKKSSKPKGRAREDVMKKLIVLVSVALVVLVAGCAGKTVHTADTLVRFNEQGIWIGVKPDPNPVIITITNHKSSDAQATVGGQEDRWDGWVIPAGKTKSLKLQNIKGDFVLLFHFGDGSSTVWSTYLDYSVRVKKIHLVPKDWDEDGYRRDGHRYHHSPDIGDMMMEMNNLHFQKFLKDQKRRFNHD